MKNEVRFYYKEMTPTLYHFNHKSNDLVILMFNFELIYDYDVYFSDGNAASKYTKAYGLIDDALKIDWSLVFQRRPITSLNKNENIRCRNAELLVNGPVRVDKYLKRIIVKDERIKMQLEQAFPKYGRIIIVDEKYFD